MNYLLAPSIVCLSQIWSTGRYEGVQALLISHIIISLCSLWHEVRTEGKNRRFGPVTCWYWCVGGLPFAKNSESSYLLPNAMVHCQCGKFLKTQRWKVRDVTCDGVKIQKGLQLISSLMSVCIFPTMFQMLMIEVERVLQSKSSLQLYLCMNTRSQVRLQLGDFWSTAGNTYYHYRQSKCPTVLFTARLLLQWSYNPSCWQIVQNCAFYQQP